MMSMRSALSAAALACAAGSAFAQVTGPSSSQSPYLLPTTGGVVTKSILTVGDTIGGYRMVGIPDGLGAYSNNNGSFSLFMNHELGGASGTARSHGSTGAFVSSWNIDSTTLAVNSGRDQINSASELFTWNGSGYTAGTTQFNRLCSGDLAAGSAYSFGGLGTTARIYMNGEENGATGRAFGHITSGPAANSTYELPALGKFSWENSVASPFGQQKTVVIGTDDSTVNGQVYVYVGNKTAAGNDIERAGLTNGNLYGIRVLGAPQSESRTAPFASGSRFDLVNQGDVTNTTGPALDASSAAGGVSNWLRPEDGAWDPRAGHQNDFYFVTTDRFNAGAQQGNSRLWRMSYDDVTNPLAGGTVSMLVDGFTQGPNMMDNICIDTLGRIMIQEDIGNNAALGNIWLYDIASGGLGVVASHDASRFTAGAPNFLTMDEESSGIMDAKDILGDGWFLLDDQAHYGISGELVEGGQLLAMYVDPSIVPAPASLAIIGLGCMTPGRRRR